ncbi:MAG: biotin/lipoyl-binding protein [Ignavibacteria bacterium]|jgi:biotin carboxyl carrier protein|nr:biotin/lipoyl-binding protein [Ignavibacteria bacterium]MCU7502688.1 biotin/lipoyl-binding protein [Ignavibacteria bacterium]MCU7515109.1 biotin/lipoyl-binding protein [Ignavibacteria bacterium]
MKKFKIKIQGDQFDIDILNIEDDVAEIVVNETSYQVEIQKKTQPPKTPTIARRQKDPSVTDRTAAGNEEVISTGSSPATKGSATIKSPLPGTVLKIHVKEGTYVKVGDRLITLEAMKMENNINSDKEGLIRAIRVKERDSVLEGDVLIEIG